MPLTRPAINKLSDATFPALEIVLKESLQWNQGVFTVFHVNFLAGKYFPAHAMVFHVALFIGSRNNTHGILYAHDGLLLMADTTVLVIGVLINYAGMFFKARVWV